MSETRHCKLDPCRIPDCDCKPLESWCIERKMHDGTFDTYAEGYPTLEKAKAAAARAGNSIRHRHTTTWRAVRDGGSPEIHEATFRAHGRAKWEAVA